MTRLFLSKLQPTRKRLERVKSFRVSVKATDLIRQEVETLIDAVELPRVLPARFYRAGRDTTPDPLLEEHGIMHLHLGSPASREPVYLIQYPERVVLLEITDHYHFETNPIGSHLIAYHRKGIEQNEADAEQEAAAELKRREDAVKGGLLPRKPRP